MKCVWIDGCFDLFHYGHANALRQAKKLGDHVICGINSFEDISKNKGLPVLSDEERYEVVNSCRWVDFTLPNVPYSPSLDLIKQYGCDLTVHGDDLALDINGKDVYKDSKEMGIFKEVSRTAGISTTEIVGRMMLQEKKIGYESKESNSAEDKYLNDLIKKFALPKKSKKGRIVFIDGVFDLYHAGHCKALENAKKESDYLIVGLHSDRTVREYNKSLPILNEKERMLVLMSNKYIDEIIFSPYVIDESFIEFHNISHVISSYDVKDLSRYASIKKYVIQDFHANPFNSLSTDSIVNRIILNYQSYVERQFKKDLK
jgi:ethanolamine-phosphate cytidylyltransferase